MTADLAVRPGLPGALRDNAYVPAAGLTFPELMGVVEMAELIADASPWWLVDAVSEIEARFPDEYLQAIPESNEGPANARKARLKQAGWMASVYPPVTRVPGATYTHHRVVADLPPGDRAYLLTAAVREQLSTRDLIVRANAIKESRRGQSVTAEGEPVETAALVWLPSRSDLTDEARQALEHRLAGIGKRHATGFESGWLQALVWADREDAFIPDRFQP